MYYVGIDLGGTNIAAGIVDESGNIVEGKSVPTKKERDFSEIIKDMAMLVTGMIDKTGISLKDIKGIGIGSPGTPNSKEGIIVYSNNIKVRNAPICTEMAKHIGLPVYLDNDANCAALAESYFGAAKGAKYSITITLGTGIGSGVILNKKIYSGFNFSAAELGHTLLIMDGEECSCGRRGCWEAYASATALIRQTREAVSKNMESYIYKLVDGDLNRINAKTAFDAADYGDETARKVVNQYIKYLAEGMINVINSFQPEILVIGGGISKQGDNLVNPLKKIIRKNIFCKEVSQTEIKIAQLGNDAGIVGAAMLAK